MPESLKYCSEYPTTATKYGWCGLVLVFVLVFLMMIGLTVMSYFLLAPVSIFELTLNVMFPIYFLGSMAFLFSTVIKNGNGTAVVMVIIGVGLLILSGILDRTMWNIFLNPYNIPNRLNEMVWQDITLKTESFWPLVRCFLCFTDCLICRKGRSLSKIKGKGKRNLLCNGLLTLWLIFTIIQFYAIHRKIWGDH